MDKDLYILNLEHALILAYRALSEGLRDLPPEHHIKECMQMRAEAKAAIHKVLKGWLLDEVKCYESICKYLADTKTKFKGDCAACQKE